MSSFRRAGLILIIVVFLALGLIYSLITPYTTGPDEVAHFQFIRFVAQHHRLPASPVERNEAGYKSDLPPLFHLMMGLAGSGIDLTVPPFIKVTQNNPRLQLVVGLENVLGWRAINTEDPYRGEVLLWYLARWGALAGGAMGLGITYSLLRSFFHPAPWLALGGIAVLAFVPLYLQVSSVISYESLTGALMAGYFWVLFRLVCTPARWWYGLRWLGQAGAVLPKLADTPGQRVGLENDRLNLGSVSLNPAVPAPSETVLLNGQPIGYTLWPQPAPLTDSQVYQENSTVVVSIANPLDDTVRVSLVGPDGAAHSPGDQTGRIYSFTVEPQFTSGEYRLRFEQRAGDQVMAQVDTPALLRVQTQEWQFQAGVIAHPLHADFAGYVALLGYDLSERQIQPGGVIPVTLYWQALKPIGADLIMFNHLMDGSQKVWGGRDRRAREVYSTMLWAPGEVVVDSFNVQVETNAPDGIYTLLVGLYLPVGQASVSLPLLQNGQLSNTTSVSLGTIKVGAAPPGLTVQAARPQVSLHQTFGDPPSLTLLGYDIDKCQVSSVKCQVSITFYWRSEAAPSTDYTVFVHLRDVGGQTVAQQDQPPLKGAYPTGLWSPGEIIADTIKIPWPPQPSPEKYKVIVGWYNPSTGQRLIVPNHPANEVNLTDVELP